MPRISRQEPKPDVLEVVHHEIPQDAAAAGAPPIPEQATAPGDTTAAAPLAAPAETAATSDATNAAYATDAAYGTDATGTAYATEATNAAYATNATYAGDGMTWRRMAGTLAITQAACYAALLVATTAYGVSFFFPIAIAAALYVGAALWIRRMTKAGAVYTLTINALCLVMFGGLFFGWTGFMYPRSWFEMAWGTFTVLVPLAGLVASIAAVRHRDRPDAAKVPIRVVAAVASALVLVGVVGTATAGDATRVPGDVELTASNFEFEQTELTAKAGNVAIYFDNDDPFEHNVEIKGVGTSSNAPSGRAIRHVFNGLKPGTYTYVCAIHPDMKGTLTVT